MGSLFAAFTAAWTILMIYVLTLASRQRRLRRSLQQLEATAASAPAGTHAR